MSVSLTSVSLLGQAQQEQAEISALLGIDLPEGEFYGNALIQWAAALVIALIAFIVLPILVALVRRRLDRLAELRLAHWLRGVAVVLQQTRVWFLFVLSLWIGSLVLALPDHARRLTESLTIVVLLLQAAVWGTHLIQFLLDRNLEERLAKNPDEATTMSALSFVGKLVLYSVVLLLILSNLGIDVTALVAGLGVGGIAVALAAQNILGDLFSSMSIVLDKPFVLGDFVIVGDLMGTVEKIGLKTTRIKSLSGEQLVFSNSDLLNSRIRNFKRMQERRIVFSIGVTYETPYETLQAIPEMIRETIEAQELARFDRAHFAKYGDFALIFEVVYYMKQPDFNLYMDTQQAINLDLFRRFAESGIEFAYPTQTVHLSKPQ